MQYRTGFLWGRLNMESGVLLQDPEGHWPSRSSLWNSRHVSSSWFLPLHYFSSSSVGLIYQRPCCYLLRVSSSSFILTRLKETQKEKHFCLDFAEYQQSNPDQRFMAGLKSVLCFIASMLTPESKDKYSTLVSYTPAVFTGFHSSKK